MVLKCKRVFSDGEFFKLSNFFRCNPIYTQDMLSVYKNSEYSDYYNKIVDRVLLLKGFIPMYYTIDINKVTKNKKKSRQVRSDFYCFICQKVVQFEYLKKMPIIKIQKI